MIRAFILTVLALGMYALWTPHAGASEADCWRGIEVYKQKTAELTELIEHRRQMKTEVARCAMLAKTREATLQKIEMSKACTPYVSTAQADLAKAQETLKQ